MIQPHDTSLYRKTYNYIFRTKYITTIEIITGIISVFVMPIPLYYLFSMLIPSIVYICIAIIISICLINFVVMLWIVGLFPFCPNMENAGELAITQFCPETLKLVLNNLTYFDEFKCDIREELFHKLNLIKEPYFYYLTNNDKVCERMDLIIDILKDKKIITEKKHCDHQACSCRSIWTITI